MDTRTFTLPDAAQILGAVWRALDLQFPKRRAQSGRKFLRGDRPGNDETRTGVLRDMASAFVEAGYVYIVDGECDGIRHRDRAVEAIVQSLAHAIAHWDQFVGARRALARPVDQADVLRYLRLAAIDIALRTAAFDRSFGWSPPPEARGTTFNDVPIWARDGGVRAWLRGLPKKLGATREELYPGKTKDDWFYRGTRPSIASIAALAASLEAFDGAPQWRMYLAWAFALDALWGRPLRGHQAPLLTRPRQRAARATRGCGRAGRRCGASRRCGAPASASPPRFAPGLGRSHRRHGARPARLLAQLVGQARTAPPGHRRSRASRRIGYRYRRHPPGKGFS